jgi:large subunit ribosomal protein L13
MKFRTWTPTRVELEAGGDWYLVDATGMTLGRLASNVARILKGKHKPTYTPHQNMGDHVVVVNADRVVVTGGKLDDKTYVRYTGHPSGLKRRTLRRQRELDSTVPVTHAVQGMLQRNRLGAAMLRRLRVYSGADHGHQAQTPKLITFNQKGDINVG